jgi:ubiquinone/menaquinone biosynthesis C-methylase UbiE
MPVHEVAQRGFGSEAETYDRSRPTYPPDALAWLIEHLRIIPDRVIADVAAGTGKMTRLLEPTGATLVAVEPVEGMWQVLRRTAPTVPVIASTAEALAFADESLDAIVVAQAFHWFDADAAAQEARRVLRRGGRLGLIWNGRDRTVDWVNSVWSVMDRVEKHAPWRVHEDPWRAGFTDERWFGPLHEKIFRHEQTLTPEGVVERFRGVSHLAVLSTEERELYLDEIREVLATHPETRGKRALQIPYRVDAYWAERSP